jgi:hypothetical protein
MQLDAFKPGLDWNIDTTFPKLSEPPCDECCANEHPTVVDYSNIADPTYTPVEGDEIKVVINRVFETGAVRDNNKNKPFIHCLLGYTRQRFGYHMSKNASKYGEFNFLKGIPTEAYLESIDRHLAAYMEGDRSEDHLSSILFGVQGIMLNEKNQGVPANQYFK